MGLSSECGPQIFHMKHALDRCRKENPLYVARFLRWPNKERVEFAGRGTLWKAPFQESISDILWMYSSFGTWTPTRRLVCNPDALHSISWKKQGPFTSEITYMLIISPFSHSSEMSALFTSWHWLFQWWCNNQYKKRKRNYLSMTKWTKSTGDLGLYSYDYAELQCTLWSLPGTLTFKCAHE